MSAYMRRRRFIIATASLLALAAGCSPPAAPGADTDGSGGTGGLDNSETGAPTTGPATGAAPTTGAADVGTGGAQDGPGSDTSTSCTAGCGDDSGAPAECDIWAQDCPEGQKCAAWGEEGVGSWHAVRCVAVTGDQQPGEPCTAEESGRSGMDDCVEGAMCWEVDADLHGTCVALCTGTPAAPVCPADTFCAIWGEMVVGLCIPRCNPLLQDCPDDEVCAPNGAEFRCDVDGTQEAVPVNAPCEFVTACDKGLTCIEASTASSACDPQQGFGCCQPFCEFPGGPCPNPDQQCAQWYEPGQFPDDDPRSKYGVCSIAG